MSDKPVELYTDQVLVASEFEEWLLNSEETVAGVWAGGGFGKSFMAKYLVMEVVLKNSNYEPVLTSMTHSAVDVLYEFMGMDVHTLHSIMGWIPQVDKETGKEFLSTPSMREKSPEPRLKPNTLLLVDEAGLLTHMQTRLLIAEAVAVGAKILLLGDNKQCFPVHDEGDEMTIPAYDNTEKKLTLTIPKRVDEGDMIYKLSTVLRAAVDGGPLPEWKTALNPDGSGRGVRHVDDIEEYAYMAFKAELDRGGDLSKVKVLAFKNTRCLTLNRKIRKKVMGYKEPYPIIGERMVANTGIATSAGSEVLIRNNQQIIVKEVERTESFGLKGAFVQYADLKGNYFEEIVFVPATPGKYLDRLKQLANDAKDLLARGEKLEASEKWRNFFALKEGCADIRYTYAMTVNKAQGITLKHALVDLVDINSCRDYEAKVRLAYTAVTRASHYATIEGEIDEKPRRRSNKA